MLVRILKFIALPLLLLVLCLPLFSCAGQVENDRMVYDVANIISEADEARINEEAKKATNARFLVFTHNADNGSKLYGEDILPTLGLDDNDDVVIFVITLANSKYYCDLYTYGVADRRIDDGEVKKISEISPQTIPQNKLGDVMSRRVEMANSAMELPYLTIVIVAIILGIVAGGIAVGVVIGKYKMRLQPTNYPLDRYAQMELTHKNDVFLRSRVAVTRVQSSSSSRGGRSGGGSSFGGGGGHRGGI